MHKAKNIYFLLIKKKPGGPRQEVAQGKVPAPISKSERVRGETRKKRVCVVGGINVAFLLYPK